MNAPDLSLQHLNIIIPEGVKYDGVQHSSRGPLLCFTVLSIKASFSILESEITNAKLIRLSTELRARFGIAPTFHAARRFCPPDPALIDECQAKEIATALRTTPENVRVLFSL